MEFGNSDIIFLIDIIKEVLNLSVCNERYRSADETRRQKVFSVTD